MFFFFPLLMFFWSQANITVSQGGPGKNESTAVTQNGTERRISKQSRQRVWTVGWPDHTQVAFARLSFHHATGFS